MALQKTPDGLEYILDDAGNQRPLGFLQGDPARMMAVAPMAAEDLIPESQWVEFDEFPDTIKRKNQNGKGACNGFATALGVETSRYVSGMPHIELSGWYVYSILCNGRDVGSMILDGLSLIEDKGCSPEELVQYGLIDPRRLTSQAHTEAARFKAEIGERLTTYEQLGSAIQRRQSINLAVCVGNSFNNLDAEGVPPLGHGYANHAVHVGLGMKKLRNGEWACLMTNSWGAEWGLDGKCWLPLRRLPQQPAFEAYTLRAVIDDVADNTKPPAIIA